MASPGPRRRFTTMIMGIRAGAAVGASFLTTALISISLPLGSLLNSYSRFSTLKISSSKPDSGYKALQFYLLLMIV